MPNAGDIQSNTARCPALKTHTSRGRTPGSGKQTCKYKQEGTEGLQQRRVGINVWRVRTLRREGISRKDSEEIRLEGCAK